MLLETVIVKETCGEFNMLFWCPAIFNTVLFSKCSFCDMHSKRHFLGILSFGMSEVAGLFAKQQPSFFCHCSVLSEVPFFCYLRYFSCRLQREGERTEKKIERLRTMFLTANGKLVPSFFIRLYIEVRILNLLSLGDFFY